MESQRSEGWGLPSLLRVLPAESSELQQIAISPWVHQRLGESCWVIEKKRLQEDNLWERRRQTDVV